MRKSCLILVLLSLVAFQGFSPAPAALAGGQDLFKEVERPEKASSIPILILSGSSPEGQLVLAAGVNCRWICVGGGSGEADVTGPGRCAAACEAACGGEDQCKVAMYIANAGEEVLY